MTVLDRAALDRWVAAWRDRAGDRRSVERQELLLGHWLPVVEAAAEAAGPATGVDVVDRCLAAVAAGTRDARRIDDSPQVGAIHLVAGLLAGAAELRATSPDQAEDLWLIGLAAADLAASGGDLATVVGATTALDERDPDPLVAVLGQVFAALRVALSIPDRIVMLECGAGPGFNPGEPVELEITCAVSTTEFLINGIQDLLEAEPGVTALECWPAGERTWLHLHTHRSGPVLERLTAVVRVEELRIAAR